jgi:hypothetical protein
MKNLLTFQLILWQIDLKSQRFILKLFLYELIIMRSICACVTEVTYGHSCLCPTLRQCVSSCECMSLLRPSVALSSIKILLPAGVSILRYCASNLTQADRCFRGAYCLYYQGYESSLYAPPWKPEISHSSQHFVLQLLWESMFHTYAKHHVKF